MENYITNTIKHYTHDAFAWTVVEDAIDDTTLVPRNIKFNEVEFSDPNGYICQAFKFAKAADENPMYLYADYGIASAVGSMKAKSDAVFQYITTWGDAKNNCGIKGVAMKISIATNITDEEIEGIRTNIKRYANTTLTKGKPYFVHMTNVEVTCELEEVDAVMACKSPLDTVK
jgi:GH35 family endo-1,4-beta-xylanase